MFMISFQHLMHVGMNSESIRNDEAMMDKVNTVGEAGFVQQSLNVSNL